MLLAGQRSCRHAGRCWSFCSPWYSGGLFCISPHIQAGASPHLPNGARSNLIPMSAVAYDLLRLVHQLFFSRLLRKTQAQRSPFLKHIPASSSRQGNGSPAPLVLHPDSSIQMRYSRCWQENRKRPLPARSSSRIYFFTGFEPNADVRR